MMAATGLPTKRSSASELTYEEAFPRSPKRLNHSQEQGTSTGQEQYTSNDAAANFEVSADTAGNGNDANKENDDDASTYDFQQDLLSCPEVFSMEEIKTQLNDIEKQQAKEKEEKEAVGDEKQMEAIQHATQGGNLFLTGRAGTGKSWASKQIRSKIEQSKKKFWAVAPTGVAAINVGGMTIHSWGGFGCGTYYSDFDKMMGKDTRKKIQGTDVLLFDEISMCDGHLFDVLECMVSIIRSYSDKKPENENYVKSVKDRVKAIKEAAPIITEAMGGARDDERDREDSIMSTHMLKMRWEDPSRGGLGDIAPWGGMQLICVGEY